jgi:hypothetical protein
MSEITRENSVRYIHLPNSFPIARASGMTIGYTRDANCVHFAFSFCIGTDEYHKSIGRERTWETLQKMGAFDDMNFLSWASVKHRSGCINFSDLPEVVPMVKNLLADHILEQMTFMDFKHAFITEMLKDICQELALQWEEMNS